MGRTLSCLDAGVMPPTVAQTENTAARGPIRPRRLTVVVPTLNESGRIRSTLKALAAARRRGAEVVVVDGGSSDATVEIAHRLADRVLSAPAAGVDPNQRSLVLLVRWHRFSMLLGADAEAEAVPLEPGPVDVLKVAHHGSDDAGLSALLARSRPGLAVISVGDGNPFGHPTAATVATLAEAGVPVMRTDRDGTVAIDVSRRGFRVDAGH